MLSAAPAVGEGGVGRPALRHAVRLRLDTGRENGFAIYFLCGPLESGGSADAAAPIRAKRACRNTAQHPLLPRSQVTFAATEPDFFAVSLSESELAMSCRLEDVLRHGTWEDFVQNYDEFWGQQHKTRRVLGVGEDPSVLYIVISDYRSQLLASGREPSTVGDGCQSGEEDTEQETGNSNGEDPLGRVCSVTNFHTSQDAPKPQTCREGHLLFYTEHQCRHIRLCPVRAKLTAPANDAGFRTAETISVHRGGFTLHDDKHSSYSRIQSKSGTKYLVNFAMSTLRCRLQQEFTG
ncbi:hypothetical protein Bbelb_236950 [Branchiostoma belcheri]|nr:hypothetical protein Bbelb_236950 [Branchiostoma belcheri]